MIKWLLAWRYFFRRPISILAVAAVMLCVFIVVVVMTVMNGLVEDFKQKNHSYAGDCVIESDSLTGFPYYEEFLEILRQQPFIEAASPVAKGVGLLTMPGADWNIGIEIHGIDPVLHSQATSFANTLFYHKDAPADAFRPPYSSESAGCIVGIDIMSPRRQSDGGYYHPDVPMALELIVSAFPLNMRGGLSRAGTDFVSTKTFYYSDDSHSGLVKVDGAVVYVPLAEAQILCGMDAPLKRISCIHIRFAEGITPQEAIGKIRALWSEHQSRYNSQPGGELLTNVRVQSWQENRRSIIAPMEKEQTMMMMLFIMLGLITVFIVLVVLYMIISHKSKDIGILKSIGAPTAEILGLFLLYSVFIGLIGAGLGSLGGWIFLKKINQLEDWLFEHYHWQLWDRSVYAIGDIPNRVDPEVLAVIIAAAVLSCLLGAIIPSLQAARKKPVQSLQVNQL